MMPGFFKDMPPAESGEWVAVVIRNYCFAGRKEVYTRKVRGLRRAYVVARIMALVDDLFCPYHDGEVGIEWAVRKSNNASHG